MVIHSPITGNLIKITVEELCLQVHKFGFCGRANKTKADRRANWERTSDSIQYVEKLFGIERRNPESAIPAKEKKRNSLINRFRCTLFWSSFFVLLLEENYFKVIPTESSLQNGDHNWKESLLWLRERRNQIGQWRALESVFRLK